MLTVSGPYLAKKRFYFLTCPPVSELRLATDFLALRRIKTSLLLIGPYLHEILFHYATSLVLWDSICGQG